MSDRIKGWIPTILAAKKLYDRTGNDVYYAPSGDNTWGISERADAYPQSTKFDMKSLDALSYKDLQAYLV